MGFGRFHAICEQALTSELNEDGSMRTNFVVDPQFYRTALEIERALLKHLEVNQAIQRLSFLERAFLLHERLNRFWQTSDFQRVGEKP